MDKFKNENPDGLAAKDVYPLAVSLKSNTNTWMGGLDWLFGAFGTIEEQWNKDESGNLEYGSVNPGAKQALAKPQEWMKKGYIHPDVASGMKANLLKSGPRATQASCLARTGFQTGRLQICSRT